MGRLLVAMSGGVDSSVAAALVAADRDPGFEVVGVWMRTHPDRGEGFEARRSCCSAEAADDARRVAAALGIPFYILNVEEEFEREVIDAFADDYLAGVTPNPCQACNQYVKFDLLLRRGQATFQADAVVTGHYARTEWRDGRWRLLRAADGDKDQTYFLWMLGQEQLARTRFPLGDMTKPAVRDEARRLGLVTADKPESQEICFVPAGDYRALLADHRGYAGTVGAVVDADGQRLGSHTGFAHYTIGQRRGLGAVAAEPRFVTEVRPATNEVVVGRREDLEARSFTVERRHFVAESHPGDRFPATVRIRHRGAEANCEVTLVGEDRFLVETETPVWAPAPGQAAVLYAGDECLGGGRIARS